MNKYKHIKKIEFLLIAIANFLFKIYFSINNKKNLNLAKKNSDLKNSRNSKECFIILGGESASKYNFSTIAGKDVFAVNHFYHTDLMQKINPGIYVVSDRKFFQNEDNLRSLLRNAGPECNIFLNGRYAPKEISSEKINYFFPTLKVTSKKIRFDISKQCSNFSTVALTCIQIAMYMGYSKINLIGFDLPPGTMPHFYKENKNQQEGIEQELNKINHYEYCELFWQYTNCLHESFFLADLAKEMNIKIINHSKSSYVKAFDKN